METESSPSIPRSCCCDEGERFLDDCFSSDYDSHCLTSSPAANLRRRRWKPNCSVLETDPSSSSSTKMGSFEKQSTVETNEELSLEESRTIEKDLDITSSPNDLIAPFPGKGDNFEAIDSFGDTGWNPITRSGSNRPNGEDDSEPALTPTDWSLLVLLVRSIRFQVRLMISFVKFPPWLVSSCIAFVTDPYRTTRRLRRYLLSKIVELCEFGLQDRKPMLQVAMGFLYAVYVGLVLFALLASAFMVSGFVITHLAREPLVIKESLYFDYTKNSPEAYVPIITSYGSPKQKAEIVVSMTLPESEYNRNLGMFQVRVDFLSASGDTLGSARRPCMVRYRSEPIRIIQTLLKIVPLVTGYVSETQSLNLKLKDDILHAACLKVVIEQRAEFRPGAGIPEIYDASLFLESELPFFERILWNWRRTLFVWIALSLFVMELLVFLVFYSSVILQRTGLRTQERDRTISIDNK